MRQARSGRREATLLLPGEWLEAGAWLADAIGRTGLGVTDFLVRLGKEGVATSASRLKSYRLGLRLPEPYTLQAICNVSNLSYVEAVDRFGYYREILKLFDDLVWLGERWLEDDDARGGTLRRGGGQASRLESLRDAGVLYWKGKAITRGKPAPLLSRPVCDPRKDAAFSKRYYVARHEAMPHVARQAGEEPDSIAAIVPKPIAIAILLGVLAFPRRGDAYKEAAPQYRYDLAKNADALMKEAQVQRSALRSPGRPKNLHPFLLRARNALDDSSIPFDYRRPIAAEHVVTWCDAICQSFTHYARLAAFDFWGDASGRSWTTEAVRICPAPGKTAEVRIPKPSTFAMLPQLREADLPEIEMLATYR